jgi:hypothetical protein
MSCDLLALYRAHYLVRDDEPSDQESMYIADSYYNGILMDLEEGLDEPKILELGVDAMNRWCLENGIVIGSYHHETRIVRQQRYVKAAVAMARQELEANQ